MRSIEDVLYELDITIDREKENMEDAAKHGGVNTVGYGMASGAFDLAVEMKKFILEEDD